jgi:hypothetical protein
MLGGMVWCGVVWCGVVWCGVVWCVNATISNTSLEKKVFVEREQERCCQEAV